MHDGLFAEHAFPRQTQMGVKVQPTTTLAGRATYAVTRTRDSATDQSPREFPTHILHLGADAIVLGLHLTAFLSMARLAHLR
jgi:hypothetical protein